MLLLFTVASFATEGNENIATPEKETTRLEQKSNDILDTTPSPEFLLVKKCSVTSTGIVQTDGMAFEITLTVTGPCDSSLAQKMRDAIKEVRGAM